MQAVKETAYRNGILHTCSVDGRCPLEEACQCWHVTEERCIWPESSRESAGSLPVK